MGFPKFKITYYDSGSQGLQELFEVQSITWCFGEFVQDSENNIEFGVKTQSFGSQENISDINSSLSWISIKWEQSMKISDGVRGEDGVFSGDFFTEDSLEIFLLNFFSAHWILKIQYILILKVFNVITAFVIYSFKLLFYWKSHHINQSNLYILKIEWNK